MGGDDSNPLAEADSVIALATEFARRRGASGPRLPTAEDFAAFRDDPENLEKFQRGMADLKAGRRIKIT